MRHRTKIFAIALSLTLANPASADPIGDLGAGLAGIAQSQENVSIASINAGASLGETEIASDTAKYEADAATKQEAIKDSTALAVSAMQNQSQTQQQAMITAEVDAARRDSAKDNREMLLMQAQFNNERFALLAKNEQLQFNFAMQTAGLAASVNGLRGVSSAAVGLSVKNLLTGFNPTGAAAPQTPVSQSLADASVPADASTSRAAMSDRLLLSVATSASPRIARGIPSAPAPAGTAWIGDSIRGVVAANTSPRGSEPGALVKARSISNAKALAIASRPRGGVRHGVTEAVVEPPQVAADGHHH